MSDQKIEWYDGDLSSLVPEENGKDSDQKHTKSSESKSPASGKQTETTEPKRRKKQTKTNGEKTDSSRDKQTAMPVNQQQIRSQRHNQDKYSSKEPPSPKGFGNDIPAFMLIDTKR